MNFLKDLLLAGAVALSASHALAGPLAIDTTAISGWHNSTGYSNSPGLVGIVDYAVWTPGTFPVGNLLGYVLTPGDYVYVYTYQACETGTAAFSQVSVTVTGPADLLSIGDFTGNNVFGVVASDPSISNYIDALDSAIWRFDAVFAGNSTDGLAYSSSNGPLWTTARNVDGSTVQGCCANFCRTMRTPEELIFRLALNAHHFAAPAEPRVVNPRLVINRCT